MTAPTAPAHGIDAGMASAQSCPINDELNALRLEALRTNADGDISAYHQRLSMAFQRGELVSPHLCADKLAKAEARERVLMDRLQWAHDTLGEINVSNYDHDDVCLLNAQSVDVILGIAALIDIPAEAQP